MDISTARMDIDRIDREITRLFCQRMQCSATIGAYKAEFGLPIYVPEREEEIINRLKQNADAEMRNYIEKLYRQIFALSRDYQRALIEKEGPQHV